MSRYEYDKRQEARRSDHGGDEERLFEKYLRSRGLKFTAARRELLHRIFDMHDHFTAEQLLERLKSGKVRVSKATVYRTLNVMLDCGLLEAHDFGEGALYYEHTHGHAHHDHMFCLSCKRIIEFRSDGIEELQERVAKDLGFRMLSHSLKIFGLCSACRSKKSVVQRFEAGEGTQGRG